MAYDFKEVELKWAKYWVDNKTFRCDVYDFSKPKYYILDMFPYPSGSGLHVGHAEGYTASDIVARMKRMQGFNVLHPIGWDAFGLPAEQYALKTNNHPAGFTEKNIENFRKQIKRLGFSYDWDREINTSEPKYYKWTQWAFQKLIKLKLAYVDSIPVNFCPELGTVLANEEVIDGKSEVGGFPVVKKPMRQWLVRINHYAERLLSDLEGLDWPASTIEMQKNWIGKSVGTEITFGIANSKDTFSVFTTRVDTLYGCTYCCLAPEHPLVDKITSVAQKDAVAKYQIEASKKSDLERQQLIKDKTGVFSGSYAVNPINGKTIPIWIADYVLGSYGSGAVMAVPKHDERDFEFAKKYHLEIQRVIEGGDDESAYTGDGIHINSDIINGLLIEQSKTVLNSKLEQLGLGRVVTNYKLRDWLFSRQRYWGEPIPVFFDEKNKAHFVKKSDLPLELPYLSEFKPSGTGESPLANAKDWVSFMVNDKKMRRETNTMPQWAGSCWYFLRYLDPNNKKQLVDKKLAEHWMGVDLYIGGSEHAVLHLLYARFWYKVLFDLGVVTNTEPFKKLFHQGIILGENGEKMSKSAGNVVSPDVVCEEFGADALRLYEMFMGPLEASAPWSSQGLEGARRFIDRVERIFSDVEFKQKITSRNNGSLDYVYNYTVKKVTADFENLQFNTAISQLMIFTNEIYKADEVFDQYLIGLIKMLYPVCPFICEEIFQRFTFSSGSMAYVNWPTFDETKTIKSVENIALQVNGKLRNTIEASIEISKAELEANALGDETIKRFIDGKKIIKVIVVPHRIVNIVVGD